MFQEINNIWHFKPLIRASYNIIRQEHENITELWSQDNYELKKVSPDLKMLPLKAKRGVNIN